MASRRGVLFVSKPLTPPWHDSGKNLARDLACGLVEWDVHVMAQKSAAPLAPHVTSEPVYGSAGTYAAGLRQNLAPLLRLLQPDSLPIYHFFFAPNPKTSMAAKAVLALKRRKSVHTLCSVPAEFHGIRKLLFADKVVALSQDTRRKLEQAGVHDVEVIPPCVPLTAPVSAQRKEKARQLAGVPAQAQLVLFAGDYEFSTASRTCTNALPVLLQSGDAHFVFACRVKREPSREVEARIRSEVQAMPVAPKVHFLNEVDDMEALVAASTVQVMPVDSLYAKMDIPLVLLESLREGVPIVVADYGPLRELMEHDVGLSVPAGSAAALAEAVSTVLKDETRRLEFGQRGREVVARHYSPDVMARKYATLYNDILTSRD